MQPRRPMPEVIRKRAKPSRVVLRETSGSASGRDRVPDEASGRPPARRQSTPRWQRRVQGCTSAREVRDGSRAREFYLACTLRCPHCRAGCSRRQIDRKLPAVAKAKTKPSTRSANASVSTGKCQRLPEEHRGILPERDRRTRPAGCKGQFQTVSCHCHYQQVAKVFETATVHRTPPLPDPCRVTLIVCATSWAPCNVPIIGREHDVRMTST